MKSIYTYLTFLFSLSILWGNAQQGDTLEVQRNENGYITFARFRNTGASNLKDGVLFLKQLLPRSDNDNFEFTKSDTDRLGIIHLRYQQFYKGIKVEGAEFLLHGRDGMIETMNGHYAHVSLTSVKPSLDETQALSRCLSYVNKCKKI